MLTSFRVVVWLAFWLGMAVFPEWFFVRHRLIALLVALAFFGVEVTLYLRDRAQQRMGR